jgi:hypothetical protein
LKSIPATLSGDDSGLRTVWQEICVQVQGARSFYWSAYEETAFAYARGLISELPAPVVRLLSAATREGDDWLDDHGADSEPMVMLVDEAARDLVDIVMSWAMDARDRAVRRHLDSYTGGD